MGDTKYPSGLSRPMRMALHAIRKGLVYVSEHHRGVTTYAQGKRHIVTLLHYDEQGHRVRDTTVRRATVMALERRGLVAVRPTTSGLYPGFRVVEPVNPSK